MAKRTQLRKTLEATEAQLERARADLKRSVDKVQSLTKKIPELQRAADALRVLVGDKPKVKAEPQANKVPVPVIPKDLKDLAQFVGPQDLSGMGSIPAGSGPKVSVPDDLLPPVDGEEILS